MSPHQDGGAHFKAAEQSLGWSFCPPIQGLKARLEWMGMEGETEETSMK